MSIQNQIHSRLWVRLSQKFYFNTFINLFQIAIQYIYRYFSSDCEHSFYYPYVSLWTHPRIKTRWYGKNFSPFKYSNYRKAKIAYFIQHASLVEDGKKKIIEPNDHILALCLPFATSNRPSALINAVPAASEWLANSNVSAVTIGKYEHEMRNQFIHYFGDELSTKLVEINIKRLVRGFPAEYLCQVLRNIEFGYGKVSFVFLASSWELKGVDLVVEAWRWADLGDAAELFLISPQPKSDARRKLLKLPKNVIYMSETPVSQAKKEKVLAACDVTIAITHVDGGATAWEGLEYGHAIVTNNYHRASSLIYNNNGFSIDLPNAYYEMGRFGVEWDSIGEYMDLVGKMENDGAYDDPTFELGRILRSYANDRGLLKLHRQRSFEICEYESLTRGNEEFSDLIKKINR